ncbi:MAG: GNAT family protein [archaeon]|nr:GNAT family N-acetyltransferase [Nanoarchaeota archaeon]
MIIKAKNFTLRPPKKSDAKSYYENKNDPIIEKSFYHFRYPYSLEKAKKYLKKIISENKTKKGRSKDIFIIEVGGKAVGEIGLEEILPELRAKLFYWIGKDYRKKGIVTEAVKLIAKHGFEKHKLRRIYAWGRTYNKASARVLEKAGFKLEGIMKKNFLKDGKYSDDFIYAKVR